MNKKYLTAYIIFGLFLIIFVINRIYNAPNKDFDFEKAFKETSKIAVIKTDLDGKGIYPNSKDGKKIFFKNYSHNSDGSTELSCNNSKMIFWADNPHNTDIKITLTGSATLSENEIVSVTVNDKQEIAKITKNSAFPIEIVVPKKYAVDNVVELTFNGNVKSNAAKLKIENMYFTQGATSKADISCIPALKPNEKKETSFIDAGFKNIAKTANTTAKDDGVHFENNGYVALNSLTSEKITGLEISFKVFVKEPTNPENVTLITKWNTWKKEMSFAIGMKKEVSFVGLTSDGTMPIMTWFDNSLLKQNSWHDIKFTFVDGKGTLYIDNSKVFEKTYPFAEIFNSRDTLVTVGYGLNGIISDFNCVYK